MDVDAYLEHIHSKDYKEISLENLTKIQFNHNRFAPYENFDLHLRKHICLELQDSYNRIMFESRGGTCIQLNSLLCWLLNELGYECYMIEVERYNYKTKQLNPLPTHMGIIVKLNGCNYYVDAISQRMNGPMEVSLDKLHVSKSGVYRFTVDHNDPARYCIQRKLSDTEWENRAHFRLVPKQLEDFHDMNEFTQTMGVPDLYLRTICCRQDNSIQVMIGQKFLEFTYQDGKETITERFISDKNDALREIRETFGIIIDESIQLIDNWP